MPILDPTLETQQMIDAKLKKIQNDTLKERIYRELKHALMTSKFKPGDRITIKALSEALGAGIMPVRESVQRLVAEGALDMSPNRTVRIPILSQSELEEIFEIRYSIEAMAAAQAARNMNLDELKAAEESYKLIVKYIHEGASPEAILEANIAFHFSIYEGAHSKHLMAFIEMLWLRVGPLLIYPHYPTAPGRDKYLEALRFHEELIEALRARDAVSSGRLIHQILETSAVWYRSNYQKLVQEFA